MHLILAPAEHAPLMVGRIHQEAERHLEYLGHFGRLQPQRLQLHGVIHQADHRRDDIAGAGAVARTVRRGPRWPRGSMPISSCVSRSAVATASPSVSSTRPPGNATCPLCLSRASLRSVNRSVRPDGRSISGRRTAAGRSPAPSIRYESSRNSGCQCFGSANRWRTSCAVSLCTGNAGGRSGSGSRGTPPRIEDWRALHRRGDGGDCPEPYRLRSQASRCSARRYPRRRLHPIRRRCRCRDCGCRVPAASP